jgi:hypothetical protein
MPFSEPILPIQSFVGIVAPKALLEPCLVINSYGMSSSPAILASSSSKQLVNGLDRDDEANVSLCF